MKKVRRDIYYDSCLFSEMEGLGRAANGLDYSSRLLSIAMLLSGALDGGYLAVGGKVLIPSITESKLSEKQYNDCLLHIVGVGCIPVVEKVEGYKRYEIVPIPGEVEEANRINKIRREYKKKYDDLIDEEVFMKYGGANGYR